MSQEFFYYLQFPIWLTPRNTYGTLTLGANANPYMPLAAARSAIANPKSLIPNRQSQIANPKSPIPNR